MVVRVNEILPPNPIFCQSRCNRRIAVTQAVRPSSPKAKYGKERKCSSGESYNNKDTGDSPFVLEKALDKRDGQG